MLCALVVSLFRARLFHATHSAYIMLQAPSDPCHEPWLYPAMHPACITYEGLHDPCYGLQLYHLTGPV